jgi:hypothetical protein
VKSPSFVKKRGTLPLFATPVGRTPPWTPHSPVETPPPMIRRRGTPKSYKIVKDDIVRNRGPHTPLQSPPRYARCYRRTAPNTRIKIGPPPVVEIPTTPNTEESLSIGIFDETYVSPSKGSISGKIKPSILDSVRRVLPLVDIEEDATSVVTV